MEINTSYPVGNTQILHKWIDQKTLCLCRAEANQPQEIAVNCKTNELHFTQEGSLTTRTLIISQPFYGNLSTIWKYSLVDFSKTSLTENISFIETISCNLYFSPCKSFELAKCNSSIILACGSYIVTLISSVHKASMKT
jgi:hypothetical protein